MSDMRTIYLRDRAIEEAIDWTYSGAGYDPANVLTPDDEGNTYRHEVTSALKRRKATQKLAKELAAKTDAEFDLWLIDELERRAVELRHDAEQLDKLRAALLVRADTELERWVAQHTGETLTPELAASAPQWDSELPVVDAQGKLIGLLYGGDGYDHWTDGKGERVPVRLVCVGERGEVLPYEQDAETNVNAAATPVTPK